MSADADRQRLADKDLLAYVEGRLDTASRQAVDQALSRDAGLQRRVAAMRRAVAEEPGLLDSVLEAPVPDRLLRAARMPARPGPGARLAATGGRLRRLLRSTGWGLAAPAGAAIAGLLIGLAVDGEPSSPGGGSGYRPAGSTAAGSLPPAALDALVGVLERGTGGGQVGAIAITVGQALPLPVDADCRWFQVTMDGARHDGIACARPPGWSVMTVETSAVADGE
ncbi:MAG: hypothetical protein RLO50_07115 [Azospirillaceae bacterium]